MNFERSIWVEVGGAVKPLDDMARLRQCIADCKAMAITDVYLQVYREGKSWFKSEIADTQPFDAIMIKGYDPLQVFLDLAGQVGIRVHAWLNVFNLAANYDAPILKQLGPTALLTDSLGVSLKDYSLDGRPPDSRKEFFSIDTPLLWLDPSHPKIRQYYNDLVQELVGNYSGLAGVHLDFFRYPYLCPFKPTSRIKFGFDFGYGQETLQRFGKDINEENSLEWDNWRRWQITQYIGDLKKIVSQRQLSTACLGWPERAYHTAYQNWPRWLMESDIGLDKACVMAYTPDMDYFEQVLRASQSFAKSNAKVVAGIGAWMIQDGDKLKQFIQLPTDLGLSGMCLFSYGNLRSRMPL